MFSSKHTTGKQWILLNEHKVVFAGISHEIQTVSTTVFKKNVH